MYDSSTQSHEPHTSIPALKLDLIYVVSKTIIFPNAERTVAVTRVLEEEKSRRGWPNRIQSVLEIYRE